MEYAKRPGLSFEIEGNLKSLEKQAKRANRYYEIKRDYKENALELAIFQVAAYKQDYQSIEQKLKDEMEVLRQTDVDNRKLEAHIEEEKRKTLGFEKNLSEKQKELNGLVNDIRELENEKRILEQRSLFSKDNQEKLNKQIGISINSI